MNSVEYAETKLGVHEIAEATNLAREELDKIYTVLAEKRDAKRQLDRDIEDREIELSIEERGKHADMSQAQMDKHLKMVYHQDELIRTHRNNLGEVLDALDGAEFDRRIQEKTIEIGCARMYQLGGYLNYLAAAKTASIAAKRSEA